MAQPTQPPNQPSPGGFGPPAYPPGPPPQGGGGGTGTRWGAIVAAVAAVALLVGGGVWYVNQGGDHEAPKATRPAAEPPILPHGKAALPAEKKPASPEGQLLFDVPLPKRDKKMRDIMGAWATKRTYAKVGKGEILGYDLGSKKQTYALDMHGMVSAASPYASEGGKAALLIEGKDSTSIAQLDIDSGRFDWRKTLPKKVPFSVAVTFSQGVAVAYWVGGAAAYDLNGQRLWSKHVEMDTGDECSPKYGGGPRLVAILECGGVEDTWFRVQEVNPLTGKAEWTYTPKRRDGRMFVVSTYGRGPVVVNHSDGEGENLLAIDEGKLLSKTFAKRRGYPLNCGLGDGVESCNSVTADDKYIFVPSAAHDAKGGTSQNELYAVNMKTGDPDWRVSSKLNRELVPIRMAGDKLIAYEDGYGLMEDSQIVSIDPDRRGKKTTFLTIPKGPLGDASSMDPRKTRALYMHGRLFLNQVLLDGTDRGEHGPVTEPHAGLAFGN